ADFEGRIVDDTGAAIAKIRTLTDDKQPGVNQGMGDFTFTPQPGKTYELKIDAPVGMHDKNGKQWHSLPAAKPAGVVLKVPQGVIDDAIEVEVTSAEKDRQLLVGAYCRGKLLDHAVVEALARQPMGATL